VVVDSPGLYVLGLQFLRRRKSALIDGAGDDARELSGHLADWLDRRNGQRIDAGRVRPTAPRGVHGVYAS